MTIQCGYSLPAGHCFFNTILQQVVVLTQIKDFQKELHILDIQFIQLYGKAKRMHVEVVIYTMNV